MVLSLATDVLHSSFIHHGGCEWCRQIELRDRIAFLDSLPLDYVSLDGCGDDHLDPLHHLFSWSRR